MASDIGVDQIVADVLDALRREDRPQLTALLHPYLHWSAGGVRIRGRAKLLTHLLGGPVPSPPVSYELRDGQIYRWVG